MNLSDLRLLYETLESRAKVDVAIASINQGYVSVDDIYNENYLVGDDHYYSSDDYVILHNGSIESNDEVFWCHGNNEYYHDDYRVTVYEGRDTNYYSRQWAESNSLVYYNGEYYDNDAMERYDLVWTDDTNEVMHIDDCYYVEDRGWYRHPQEEYVRGYHNGSYQELSFDGKSKYKIGFEIEKEDKDIRNGIDIEDFENETDNLWRKERDGSLNDDSGYELISPTFEFDIEKIFEHIESNNVLLDHINANYTTCCGGHIHLSETGLSGEELFDKLKGYTPLLYALYHGRVNKNYCKGKCNDDLKNESEKYQAIKIHYNRVEFRIISAVPNVTTLKWRCKLLMMMLQYPTDDVVKAYYNVDTKFTKLLKQVYSPERLADLKERFIKFTKEFENLNIK